MGILKESCHDLIREFVLSSRLSTQVPSLAVLGRRMAIGMEMHAVSERSAQQLEECTGATFCFRFAKESLLRRIWPKTQNASASNCS